MATCIIAYQTIWRSALCSGMRRKVYARTLLTRQLVVWSFSILFKITAGLQQHHHTRRRLAVHIYDLAKNSYRRTYTIYILIWSCTVYNVQNCIDLHIWRKISPSPILSLTFIRSIFDFSCVKFCIRMNRSRNTRLFGKSEIWRNIMESILPLVNSY